MFGINRLFKMVFWFEVGVVDFNESVMSTYFIGHSYIVVVVVGVKILFIHLLLFKSLYPFISLFIFIM